MSNANADQNRFPISPCMSDGHVICSIESAKRTELADHLAHYEIVLRVGSGPFDKIGLHRIVKEIRPWNAVNARHATMLVSGDAYGFGSFIASLNSNVVPHDHSIAIQMATAGIDVWGIDLRWTRVPADTANLDVMANWGVDVDLNDLDVAIDVARNIRKVTGDADIKLNLLGWSRGGQLGYLYLARESQQRLARRNIKSFVPVDILLKTNDESIRQSACLYSALLREQMTAGKYYDDSGLVIQNLAALAQYFPDQPSPVMEGLTNKQFILLLLTSTYVTVPPGTSFTPWYHYSGGQFDESGLPIDLSFTKLDYMYEYAAGTAPYEPTRLLLEATDLTCGEVDSNLDDHLADISVPILYVYSAGGFGKTGLYTTHLTNSKDISSFGVQTLPDEMAAIDFGHVDLFAAQDANALVWQRIIRWIKLH